MKKIFIGLFCGSILLFLITHIIQLEKYPIYFFCDEAVQAVKADYLLTHGFHDELGNMLPMRLLGFYAGNMLGLSIHLNMIGVLLFGKSVLAVRMTTVILSLFGSIVTSIILKSIFKVKNYWVSLVFLAFNPIFFIHSRTGFETAISTSFFSISLLFFLLFRIKKPFFIYPGIIFAALSVYTYAGIWLPIFGFALLFLLTQVEFLFKNLKTSVLAFLLCILLFGPLAISQIKSEDRMKEVLKNRNSYLVEDIPLTNKLQIFVGKYIEVLNPAFIFFHQPTEEPRHFIKGYNFFPIWVIPIVLIGFIISLKNIKNAEYQIVLIAFLSSPLGGTIVSFPAVTRILPIVIPLSIFFGIGIRYIESSIYRRSKYKKLLFFSVLSIALWIGMAIYTVYFTNYTLTKDPILFKDYGLYGMQYGAKPLFETVSRSLDAYNRAVVSADFANATDIFIPFFLSNEKIGRTLILGAFDDKKLFMERVKATDNTIFFSPKDQYDHLSTMDLFEKSSIRYTIYAPDGSVAFYGFEISGLTYN